MIRFGTVEETEKLVYCLRALKSIMEKQGVVLSYGEEYIKPSDVDEIISQFTFEQPNIGQGEI